LCAIWLFAGLDNVAALAVRTGHFDHSHTSIPRTLLVQYGQCYPLNTKM
jgi:hypothetical protein